eukprot:COSAG04_NODE_2502_length_4005_cov_2.639017_3_plen_66_part_00
MCAGQEMLTMLQFVQTLQDLEMFVQKVSAHPKPRPLRAVTRPLRARPFCWLRPAAPPSTPRWGEG